MTERRRCQQDGCKGEATERFAWPGADWLLACASHALAAAHVADAMGFKLIVEPLPDDDEKAPAP